MSDAPTRGFSDAEYARRTALAQGLMAAQGLSGLVLMTEAEVRYFSGFHTLFWQSPNPSLVPVRASNWQANCGHP